MASKSSAHKVAYDLRPAKHIERKMMIEAFQFLSQLNYPISTEYTYIGFGALTFVDFVLFYKTLGINSLISIEHDQSLQSRVLFNKPYKNIDIKMGSVKEVISELDRDSKYILWLDYDCHINGDIVSEIINSLYNLSEKSFLIVTVDVDPPSNEIPFDKPDKPKSWYEYYNQECGNFFEVGWNPTHFNNENLAQTNIKILSNIFSHALTNRSIDFTPIFSFDYKDGHRMVTAGIMLTSQSDQTNITSKLNFLDYLRFDFNEEPFKIKVPTLTKREKMYLDQHMPCDADWTPTAFDMDQDEVIEYRKIFKYFPIFSEVFME